MDLCVFDGVRVALDNMKYYHPGAHGAVIFFSIKYTKNIPNVEAVHFVFGTRIF